ncbi:MAG: E3 ubiquitin ligase family protein, partial [Geobacteraceae bacterium]|nr:E3 ubiquitin ligase family protein [Geobacteraceae bacterium]
EFHVFVQTTPRLSPEDEELAQELAAKGFADMYTLRQRLQGVFPARLAQGSSARMAKLAQVLEQHKHPYRKIIPPAPTFTPEPLQDLSLSGSQVVLRCAAYTLRCNHEVRLLAVVSDISARIAERHLKRMLVRHTYGGGAQTPFDLEALEQEIFRLSPLVDIYQLNSDGNPEAGIRIIPGKFDHRQLGAAASLSRNKNLEALWHKIKNTCPDIRTHYGFGMGFMPDCTPETVSEVNAAYTHRGNLRALTHYAWLMAELDKEGKEAPGAGVTPKEAAPHQSNALASLLPLTPTISGASETQADSPAQKPSDKTAESQEAVSLPQAPDPTTLSGLKLHLSWQRLLPVVGSVIVIGISLVQVDIGDDLIQYLFSYGIAQISLAGLCFYFGTKYLLLKRRVEDTPTSKIRSMAMGMVEIQGHAKRIYALVSPISGIPCVYYKIKKYKRKRFRTNRRLLSAHGESQWSLVSVTSSSNVPFLIEDGTGSVEVKPEGADLKIRTSHSGSGARTQLPFCFSETHNDNERWQEEVIPAGSYVYILGFAHAHNEAPAQREVVRQALSQLKQNDEELKKFDMNGDGNIDITEWDQARQATEKKVLTRQLNEGFDSQNSSKVCITHPPQRSYPFLIAETESELHLTRKFTYYSGIFLAAGFALALWGLYAAGQILDLI